MKIYIVIAIVALAIGGWFVYHNNTLTIKTEKADIKGFCDIVKADIESGRNIAEFAPGQNPCGDE